MLAASPVLEHLLARFALFATAMAVLILFYAFVPAIAQIGPELVTFYGIVGVASLITLVATVHRRRLEPRLAWWALITTVAAWLTGNLVYDLIGTDPVISAADALYLVGWAALFVSAFAFSHGRWVRDTSSLIEAAMVTVAAAFAAWLFLIEPQLSQEGASLLGRWLVVAYPTLGVATLFVLVRTSIAAGFWVPTTLVIAGLAVSTASDAVYAGLQQTDGFVTFSLPLIEAGWLVFYALAAAAALHPAAKHSAALNRRRPTYGPVRLAASGGALVALPALFVGAVFTGLHPHIGGFLLAILALIPLVLWRTVLLQEEIRRSQQLAASRETYYRTIATHASDAFVVTDGDLAITDASGVATAMFGRSTDTLIGRPVADLVHPGDRQRALALLDDVAVTASGARAAELRVVQRPTDVSTETRWVELRATNLLDEPAVRGLVVNLHDVTARKSTEQALEHQTLHDTLTGLPNRTLLRDRIETALTRRRRASDDVAVIFCDLDGFKSVNDGVGPEAGDRLLATVGRRLATCVRAHDTVARLGGDEFAILLEGGESLEHEAIELSERLRAVIAELIDVNGIPIVLTASVGVTLANTDGGDSADDLLRNADTAMYAAKAAGRDQALRYRTTMQRASLNRVQIAADLRSAVSDEQLLLHYQPIHDLRSGAITGFEALVRWRHPSRGLLLPWRFVPIAEQAGSIVEVGAWVLAEACQTAAGWVRQPTGGTWADLHVNLAPRQLRDPKLVHQVANILETSGFPPERLVLELTETALVTQTDLAIRTLRDIKAIGVRLAIDDFGVGYSSLSYLREFPADILKIDRSYIAAIRQPDEVPALVRGLLDLGRTLDLEVIAEGIETEAQQRALVAENCRFGQGFFFSRAVAPDSVGGLVVPPSV